MEQFDYIETPLLRRIVISVTDMSKLWMMANNPFHYSNVAVQASSVEIDAAIRRPVRFVA
ncbi:hypothetical protein L915_20181 [Phytophthora nicotianae]|nr:hypothetical protein L915_20181 [Phytophthora nicotianae]